MNYFMGVTTEDPEYYKSAQQYFQLVGSSASECDTIPGRLCMMNCFFILKGYDDALIYANSVAAHVNGTDDFQYNYGLLYCNVEQWNDGFEKLASVSSIEITQSMEYCKWFVRSSIKSGNFEKGWKCIEGTLFVENIDTENLLLQFADDCYEVCVLYK